MNQHSHVAFFLTGKRAGEALEAVEGLGLRPALFAGYRDLTKLRYDFPLVFTGGQSDPEFARSLSGLIDELLSRIANIDKGADGDRIRKHVLRLEQGIRERIAAGARGSLSALWDEAATALASIDKTVAESLARARAACSIDGEMADCDQSLPSRLLAHAWRAVQGKKTQEFGENLARLILRLEDILKADFASSASGRSAANLRAAFGTTDAESFDFGLMSRYLGKSTPETTLSETRRRRIRDLLAVLRSQRFFALSAGSAATPAKPYSFAFDSCAVALNAYRDRLPEAIELARTIAVAELVAKGEYRESTHDPIFEAFGENGLDPRDLAAFPDYLVCINAGSMPAGEGERLTEILSAGLPMKILVQTDDLFDDSPVGNDHLAIGLRSRQLASVAIGLNQVFVLQTAASNLHRFRDRIARGLACPGPALFSIYSGASAKASGLDSYLGAAAAMESRVFPAFTYDPWAGPDWASRFSLAENPQPELDWPVRNFAYENEWHQRMSENVAFTLVDFVACDRRHARHFARIPRAQWNGSMIPVDESVARENRGMPDKVPCLLMVDGNDILQKVIVDEKLLREARRCREMWHSLQELGGIHNSHALRLLAREKQIWESQRPPGEAAASVPRAATPAAAPAPAAPSAGASVAAREDAPAAAEPERSRDETWIDTPRCSTCNECTTINNKMFAYDANKQAYIADITAGSYAQLVEAAENCQVAIIHPGKPRNPKEPGLEDLIKRAEPFL